MNDPEDYNDLFEEMRRAEEQALVKHVYVKDSKISGYALHIVRTFDSFLEMFSVHSGIPPIIHPD